jgi:hypothetical protein
MRAYEFIFEDSYIGQISQLTWRPINSDVWETIQFEGLDEEQGEFDPRNWVMATLAISPQDSAALSNFNDDTVNDFNSFDIELKEKFPGYVDLIDYDRGSVTIVRTK